MSEQDKKVEQEDTHNSSSDNWVDRLAYFIFCVGWLVGFIIANGFWSTLFAIIPFWAWYLTMEKILQSMGWI